MKKTFLSVVILILVSVTVFAQQEQTRKEEKLEKKRLEFAETDSLIQSHAFTFEAENAVSNDGLQIDLTTHIAYLNILGDTVETQLPFFGRAYTTPNGSNELGIKFETQALNYKVDKNKDKFSFDLYFEAKTEFDSYQCYITVFAGSSAILSMASNQKAHIKYNGKILPYGKN